MASLHHPLFGYVVVAIARRAVQTNPCQLEFVHCHCRRPQVAFDRVPRLVLTQTIQDAPQPIIAELHLPDRVSQQVFQGVGGGVSKVEMVTLTALIYSVLFPSISAFETPPNRALDGARETRLGRVSISTRPHQALNQHLWPQGQSSALTVREGNHDKEGLWQWCDHKRRKINRWPCCKYPAT